MLASLLARLNPRRLEALAPMLDEMFGRSSP
jgi:hypothetical protein